MKIETERLIIRSIQSGDEKVLANMASDGSFSELGFDEDCTQWIEEWIDEAISLSDKDNPRLDYICCILCLKSNGNVIGTVGNTYYEDTQKIGICYGIGLEYRNQGYASEAVKAYLGFFFKHYGEEEIIATISADNIFSCKTAEKAGFKLLEKRMYKDIYDAEERLYNFYSAKAFDLSFNINENLSSVSVAIKDIPEEEWKTEVWDKNIIPDADVLYKKPGYTCEE